MPRPMESRLPFNSPEVGAPVPHTTSNRPLTRSAAKVLRQSDNHVSLESTNSEKKNRTNIDKENTTKTSGGRGGSNTDTEDSKSETKLTSILRTSTSSDQKDASPATKSTASTPPRKQVLFADEEEIPSVESDTESNKENDATSSSIAMRMGTPFRPRPCIFLHTPLTMTDDNKEIGESSKEINVVDDETSSPRINRHATIPLLMLTSALCDAVDADETDSLQVVVPMDVVEEDYDQDWDCVDESFDVPKGIGIPETIATDSTNPVAEEVVVETVVANDNDGHIVKVDHGNRSEALAHEDVGNADVSSEDFEHETDSELTGPQVSWQGWTMVFALLLFTAPFLLAAEQQQMSGVGMPQESPSLTVQPSEPAIVPEEIRTAVTPDDDLLAEWTVPESLETVSFTDPSPDEAGEDNDACGACEDDAPVTASWTTSSTTTISHTTTIHVSTTTQTTRMSPPPRPPLSVPSSSSSSSHAMSGTPHPHHRHSNYFPTTDLEDRYLLMVEKWSTTTTTTTTRTVDSVARLEIIGRHVAATLRRWMGRIRNALSRAAFSRRRDTLRS